MSQGVWILAAWPLQFAPAPLGPVAWSVLVGVPVGIVALYFLKLRRRPVQVPSTLLWRRSLEDLQVNSLFQRLRRNLLLFLQLLAVLLAMLALAGPKFQGMEREKQRLVLAIDESASMAATDTDPTRLEAAKVEARKIIDAMGPDDLAMIIAFSDRARVVTSYTGNRNLLRKRLAEIQPTEGTTSLREALQLVAGLANPQKQVGEGVVATSVVPPKMYLFTDGGFPDIEGFSLGQIEPHVVVIGPPPPPIDESVPNGAAKGSPPSDNVAILALQASRNEEKPDQYQVFGRVHNFRAEPVETRAVLLRHDPSKPGNAGILIDAVELAIDSRSEQAFKFDLSDTGAAELEVKIEVEDALPLDDRAFTVFGNPRKAQVLLVTAGNRFLSDTLKTEAAQRLADVVEVTSEEVKAEATTRELAAGRFDLVIFDGVTPDIPPEANTLYFGVLPPGPAYKESRQVQNPVILDWDVAHPLTQYVRDLNTIVIRKAIAIEPPNGSTTLIDGSEGPLAFVVPRGGYVDTVVGFGLVDGREFNTNWPLRYSFPLFLFNALRVLGNARESAGNEIHLPGQPVVLRAESLVDQVEILAPDGRRAESVSRSPQGTFVYNHATKTGLYHVTWGESGRQTFAVNLFDLRESDLAPRGLVPPGVPDDKADQYRIKIGYNAVEQTRVEIPAEKQWWWPITLAVLGIILLEWYIYNRRVYV